MRLKLIAVVLLAALFAAGLGYGLLKLKDRNGVPATPVERAAHLEAPPVGMVPPPVAQAGQPVLPPPLQQPQAQPSQIQPQQPQLQQPQGQVAVPVPPGPPPSGGQLIPPYGSSAPQQFVLSPAPTPFLMLGMAPNAVMQAANIPENSSPLPPDALMRMAVEDRQTYFEFLIKPTAAQKELLTKYFSALGQVEMKNREITMRTVRVTQLYANMPPEQQSGVPVALPGQFILTLEEQAKENELQSQQIKQAVEARTALFKTLSKEQSAKIKLYVDAKVY